MYVAGARGEQLILMLIFRCWQALHCLLRALSDPICKRPPFLDPSRRCQCQTSAYVSIRQHTSAYVSFVFGMCVCVERERKRGASKKNARGTGSQASHRSNTRNLCVRTSFVLTVYIMSSYIVYYSSAGIIYYIVQHTSAYISIRQHTSAYVSIRQRSRAPGGWLRRRGGARQQY